MLGVFEYGRIVMLRQLVNNAVREGARLAIVSGASQPSVTTQQVKDTVANYLAGQSLYNVDVQIYQADPATGQNLGSFAFTPYGGAIAVQLDADFTPVLPTTLGILPSPIHLKAVSTMLNEAN